MRWSDVRAARTSKIGAACASAGPAASASARSCWRSSRVLRPGSVRRAAECPARPAGRAGAVPGIGRRSAVARVRLGRARGYRGQPGARSSPPPDEPTSSPRWCCSRAPSSRRAASRRPRSARSIVPAITRSTSTCRSTRTCRIASARRATSRRRTSSRTKSVITCRRCSAFPSATWQRAQRASEAEANALSVRQELQADCFAGIWAHNADRSRQLLEAGDIEEGLNAASAIGDDRLQRQARGYVSPESFTHGSSEQRVRWFKRGFETGGVESCDTFAHAAIYCKRRCEP